METEFDFFDLFVLFFHPKDMSTQQVLNRFLCRQQETNKFYQLSLLQFSLISRPMSCHRCNLVRDRTIPAQRQRYIPTFAHNEIFNYDPVQFNDTKCSPTFHSTALNTEGYQIKTHHDQPKHHSRPATAAQSRASKVRYQNESQKKRVQAFNPHSCCANQKLQAETPEDAKELEPQEQPAHQQFMANSQLSASRRDNWFDHTREDMLMTLGDCSVRGYSRERKIFSLSSDPVFTDYLYGKDIMPSSKSNLKSNPKVSKDRCQNRYCKCGQNCQCGSNCQCGVPQEEEKSLNQKSDQQNRDVSLQAQANDLQDSLEVQQQKDSQLQLSHKTNELKIKGKKVGKRQESAKKSKPVSQQPTFTVIRKNRPSCH